MLLLSNNRSVATAACDPVPVSSGVVPPLEDITMGHVQAISLCYSIQALYCTCTAVKCLSQVLVMVMVSSNHCHVTQIFFVISRHITASEIIYQAPSLFNTTSNRQGLEVRLWLRFMKHQADQQL